MSARNYSGVVATLNPPKLKYLDQPSLMKFETGYTVYKAEIDGFNKDRVLDDMITAASIEDDFGASSLQAKRGSKKRAKLHQKTYRMANIDVTYSPVASNDEYRTSWLSADWRRKSKRVFVHARSGSTLCRHGDAEHNSGECFVCHDGPQKGTEESSLKLHPPATIGS